jgi:hypothetical protein
MRVNGAEVPGEAEADEKLINDKNALNSGILQVNPLQKRSRVHDSSAYINA